MLRVKFVKNVSSKLVNHDMFCNKINGSNLF